ncbi:unnamed protein product [Lampetra fluviatilis]
MSLLRQQRQQHGARELAAGLSRVAARPPVQCGRAPVSMRPAPPSVPTSEMFTAGSGLAREESAGPHGGAETRDLGKRRAADSAAMKGIVTATERGWQPGARRGLRHELTAPRGGGGGGGGVP